MTDEVNRPFLATHDPITELPNRQLFYDRLTYAHANAKRYDFPFSVMMLELDNFSNIQDTLEKEAVQSALRALGRRIVKSIREADTVARFAGETFGLVLSRLADPKDIEKVAQTILDVLSMPLLVDESNFIVTASVGIALFPQDATDSVDLLKKAEVALQQAKAKQGNCFELSSAV